MPENDLNPAIAVLEGRLAEHERKGNELRTLLNMLYVEAGLSPKYQDVPAAGGGGSGGGAVLTAIKRDSFYGKKQMTAIREYLEMRRAQGNGPATPREILEALKAGGYRFEAKNDGIALVGLRALLRKATKVFHKLPGTGNYGLLAWYPDAKPNKADDDGENGAAARKSSKSKARVKAKAKRGAPAATAKGGHQAAAAEPTAAPEGK
jgi:hypothetical protein